MISPHPSLDDLARDPSLARHLPPRTLEAIVIKCAAVQSAAAVALVEAAEHSKKDEVGDRLLSVEEAADKLSVTIVLEIERELRALLAQQEELKSTDEIVRQPKTDTVVRDDDDDAPPAVLAIQRLLQESPKTKEQIVENLQRDKFGFNDKSPARVVHLTLVNMKHRGLVEQIPTGQWRLHKQAA